MGAGRPHAATLASDPGGDYLIDLWQTEQGLPQNHITAITQTRDGYLWLGTYEGLARFDGVRFVVYRASRESDLPSSRITSLFEDGSGTLWIGHEHGQLTRLTDGRFVPVPMDAPAVRGSVAAIGQAAAPARGAAGSGPVWLVRRSGLAQRISDQQEVSSEEGLTLPILVRASNGPLWRAHGGRLTALPDAGTRAEVGRATPAPFYPRTNDFVINACASQGGGLWVLTGERLRHWEPGGNDEDHGRPPWGNSPVPRMLESRSGHLWFGTQERGLFVRHPDGAYRQFTRTNGLPNDWIRSLWEDREGTVWVGTGGGGLCAIRRRRVSMVQSPDGWEGRVLLSVSASPDGGLWAGTEGAGLYRIREDGFERLGPAQGLANPFVWATLDAGPGAVWAGTWGRGLFRQQGERWLPVAGLDQEGLVVTALHRDPAGVLWVGTHRGLARVTGDRVDWIGRELSSPEVRSIAPLPDGSVWFGMSGGGLGRWREGTGAEQFRKTNGMPANDVWSLLPSARGGLWIGTVGGGLARWRNGRFASIGEAAGLPNDVICQIADDGRGSLWLGTRGGIFRAAETDLERCADGQLAKVPFFALGRADGLATLECAGGFQPSHGRTPDGRLWFPTARGLAVVDPGRLWTNTLAPPVRIESLLVGGAPAWINPGPPERLRIPPGRQRFEFRFTALSFIAPEQVRFRYRLEGIDPDWTEESGQRFAAYNLLPPGDYTFRVTAANSDGIWNTEGATLAFTVVPQFWQTWWFQALAALAGAGAVAGAVRFVTRRRYREKLERMERQRAVERERSRIARDIHDDLGASLTRITLLSQMAGEELDRPDLVGGHLQRIDSTARELTKALEEIVWAVSPQHDSLDSLVTYLGRLAQDLASAAGMRCRIDMPTALPAWPVSAEVRHNLFLALKEAINNTLRHARASELRLALTVGSRDFTLTVEDNGQGFTPPSPSPNPGGNPPPIRPGGNGLNNMRRRLAEIGGACEVQSRPGAGTIIRFIVPATVVS